MRIEKIKIKLAKPDYYVGMVVEKPKTKHTCLGYRDYTRKDGQLTYIFTWQSVSVKTGKIFTQETSYNSFSVNDLKNHPEERNPKKVKLGQQLAARNAALRKSK